MPNSSMLRNRTIVRIVFAVVLVLALMVIWLTRGGDELHSGWTDCTAPQIQSALPVSEDRETVSVALEQVSAVEQPVAFAESGGAMLVATVSGQIVDADSGEIVLDLTSEVLTGSEQGLFDIEFSPDGAWLYVSYTRKPDGRNQIEAWPWDGDGSIELDERVEIMTLDQPHRHHNGGGITFGPDDMLYVGFGDGGGEDSGDPKRVLSTDNWFGKLLRVEPTPEDGGYDVPDDNPHVGDDDWAPEIWHHGLRNPWRFGFDEDGSLWIADVGQNCVEEINVVEPGVAGLDFGWPGLEGTYQWAYDAREDAVPPVFEYLHVGLVVDKVTCAIAGGEVYRGDAIPDLVGVYVFSDFCDGEVRGIRVDDGTVVEIDLGISSTAPVAVSADETGELHVLSFGDGGVWKIVSRSE